MEITKPRIVKRSLKIVIISVVLAAAMFCFALLAAEPVLNSSAIKSQIENIVDETLDMRFRIEGRIELNFWPFLSVAANNLNVSTSQGKIASADRIEIDPRLPDLISLKVHLNNVHIQNPKLIFDPHTLDKIFALAAWRSDDPLPVESLVIESFSISNAKFYYSDDQSVVDVDEINIDGGRIAIIENHEVAIDDVESFFRDVNFNGDVSAQQVISRDFKLTNIKVGVKGDTGLLAFDPVELEYLGSAVKLHATLDLSNEKPFLDSQISISGMNIGTLAQKFSPDHKIKGKVNFIANISTGPIDIDQILGGASGNDYGNASASNNTYPVRSFNIKEFTVAANEVAYSREIGRAS